MEFEKIRAIISEQLEVNEEEITYDSLLEELGADSLDLVDIVMELEDEFDVEVPEEVMEYFSTVGDIVDFIEST